jgi:hypothetical protein
MIVFAYVARFRLGDTAIHSTSEQQKMKAAVRAKQLALTMTSNTRLISALKLSSEVELTAAPSSSGASSSSTTGASSLSDSETMLGSSHFTMNADDFSHILSLSSLSESQQPSLISSTGVPASMNLVSNSINIDSFQLE